jgi:signal transduction histidine kinase
VSGRTQRSLLVGLVVAVAGVTYLASVHGPFPPIPEEVVLGTTAPAVYVIAGVLVGRWRPHNRTAWWLVLAGALGLVGQLWLSNVALLFTIGSIVGGTYLAVVLHLLLALPDGRLRTPVDRGLVWTVYTLAAGAAVLPALFEPCDNLYGYGCPGNVLLLRADPGLAERLGAALTPFVLAATVAVAVRLVVRWSTGSVASRRVLGPALVAALPLAGALVLDLLEVWDPAETTANLVRALTTGGLPIAILLGVLRTRGVATGLGDLAVRVGPATAASELDTALALALGDPDARLVSPGTAVAAPGRRHQGIVDREGRTLALLEHDVALAEEPELVTAVAATAGLALENAQLADRVRQQLDDVRASRARLAAAQDEERRRIERDLHDGAQQRLVSARLLLGLVLEEGCAGELVADAAAELSAAIEELREFARGVHPSLVTERGLAAALDALAERARLPVTVDGAVSRLPTLTETTAYFVVAESLTNVAKHAQATAASVRLGLDDGQLVVEVGDDGVGGAKVDAGTGLLGLRDRVEAVGGRFTVDRGSDGGTIVRAALPVTELPSDVGAPPLLQGARGAVPARSVPPRDGAALEVPPEEVVR